MPTSAALFSTRLSTKGQLVIPRSLRERTQWQPGLELSVQLVGDELRIKPAVAGMPNLADVEAVVGSLAGKAALRLSDAELAKRMRTKLLAADAATRTDAP